MGYKRFLKQLEGTVMRIGKELARTFPYPDACKFCGSKRIVRFGHYKQVQRWWCKDCKRKFVDNDALPKMQTPIIQVASALSMFYEGMSLHGIRRNLEQTYRNYVSNSTIYEWVVRFTKVAIKAAQDYKPIVGDTWVADETVLKIEGKNLWFWDIIDDKTRFLLASHISLTRTTRDAQTFVERAAERAGKAPKVIITDKLAAYLDGIELAFGADTKHMPAKRLTTSPGTQLIERFHGTLKARTNVMRGLKTRKSAKLITDGWLVHYNFFRPHEALDSNTPSQKAGIKFPFRNWLDIVRGG
jgi:putative transposase